MSIYRLVGNFVLLAVSILILVSLIGIATNTEIVRRYTSILVTWLVPENAYIIYAPSCNVYDRYAVCQSNSTVSITVKSSTDITVSYIYPSQCSAEYVCSFAVCRLRSPGVVDMYPVYKTGTPWIANVTRVYGTISVVFRCQYSGDKIFISVHRVT